MITRTYSITVHFLHPSLEPSGGNVCAREPYEIAETIAGALPDAQFHLTVTEIASDKLWRFDWRDWRNWREVQPQSLPRPRWRTN